MGSLVDPIVSFLGGLSSERRSWIRSWPESVPMSNDAPSAVNDSEVRVVLKSMVLNNLTREVSKAVMQFVVDIRFFLIEVHKSNHTSRTCDRCKGFAEWAASNGNDIPSPFRGQRYGLYWG